MSQPKPIANKPGSKRPTIRSVTGRRRNLLIEIGTEELPPKALKQLAESFSQNFYAGLESAGVVENGAGNMQYYATPRRLAVWIKGVLPKQPDQMIERRGPALKAAFDDKGNPTSATEGFARSCGVPISRLKQKHTDKGTWLVFEKKARGSKLNLIVTQSLRESVNKLPIPKKMRWGDGEAEFVRPAHWLLALYGSDLIRTEVLGLKSNRFTRGHRFHCPGELKILSADRYLNTLKTIGHVIADYETRQSMIVKQVARLTKKIAGRAIIEQNLLDEVTGLVEWPVSLVGEFDKKYLKLPIEVLVSTMRGHQKYFHITNEKGRPEPKFIAVSNIKSKSPKRVRQGNERVLQARLSDAEFFWKTDQKIKLEDRVDDLKGVLFHNKLGTIFDKTKRIEILATSIAKKLPADKNNVKQAAHLCKTDLVTDMVSEFPELQGVVGKYYAENQGANKQVSTAIAEHYQPRFSGDQIPKKLVSQCIALADRIDTLVGIFACGETPSGDKDPFGLRRAALGVVRIMIEGKLNLDLKDLIKISLKSFEHSNLKQINIDDQIIEQVLGFIFDRLKGYLQSLGYSADEFAAVVACKPTRPADFLNRIAAVNHFFNKRKDAAEALTSANKRIDNILSKSEFDLSTRRKFLKKLIREDSESKLAEAVDKMMKPVMSSFKDQNYATGLELLADLKAPIDEYFDTVMVMHDDPEIRNNRLSLLANIREMFLGVADISKIRLSQ